MDFCPPDGAIANPMESVAVLLFPVLRSVPGSQLLKVIWSAGAVKYAETASPNSLANQRFYIWSGSGFLILGTDFALGQNPRSGRVEL